MLMLERVRKSLLDEALKSPTLLSDLAGLEQYVAESYDARAFVELLQTPMMLVLLASQSCVPEISICRQQWPTLYGIRF